MGQGDPMGQRDHQRGLWGRNHPWDHSDRFRRSSQYRLWDHSAQWRLLRQPDPEDREYPEHHRGLANPVGLSDLFLLGDLLDLLGRMGHQSRL